MKKLFCAILALTLILTLAACGNKPVQPPASQPDASQSSEPAPEPQEEPQEPAQPDEPAQPEEPEPADPGRPVQAEGPFTEAVCVALSGLADNHAAEVILPSGEYLVLQFDPDKYGELFQVMEEGDEFWITYEDTRPDEEAVFYGITQYFGPNYQGVMLAEGGDASAVNLSRCAWYMKDNENANAACLLYLTEDLTDLAFYRVVYQEDGSFQKEKALATLDTLSAGCAIGLELDVPETIPNLMLEYTRADGTLVQHLIASDLSGLYLPVCLVTPE